MENWAWDVRVTRAKMLAMRMVFFMIPGVGFARRAWRVWGIPRIIGGLREVGWRGLPGGGLWLGEVCEGSSLPLGGGFSRRGSGECRPTVDARSATPPGLE